MVAALLCAGAALRAALLAWGAWQDDHLQVRFTDIDYEVYTDAARGVVRGGSPYERSTYRYTPLLAWAMTPNVTLHKAAGKLLFCSADLLAAWLLDVLLRRRGVPRGARLACVALWLFSPFTATISARGNGEALVSCMLLAMLLCLETGRVVAGGALFGLAVHWRLYPAIFGLPILRSIALGAAGEAAPASSSANGAARPRTRAAAAAAAAAGPAAPWLGLVSRRGAAFGAAAAAVFLGLGAALYRLYGQPFLQESYLYHTSRVDPRHNFSPYFLPAYLASAGGPATLGDGSWAFSVALLAVQAGLGARFAGGYLPACLLLQTVALVALNRVCTAQYFVWYLTLLPLVLPRLMAAPAPVRTRLLAAGGGWAAAMGHWLAWAYALEFGGRPVHLGVWAAGLLFYASHVWVLVELVGALGGREEAPAAARPAALTAQAGGRLGCHCL